MFKQIIKFNAGTGPDGGAGDTGGQSTIDPKFAEIDKSFEGKSEDDLFSHFSSKVEKGEELSDLEKEYLTLKGIKIEVEENLDNNDIKNHVIYQAVKSYDDSFDDEILSKVDFNKPESVTELIATIADKRFAAWEEKISEKFPKEFEALLLAMEGKDPSILYTKSENSELISVELVDKATGKQNVEAQKAVYRQSLKSKGLEPSDIEDLIQTAEDSKKLLEKATKAQEDLKAIESKREEEQRKKIADERALEERTLTNFENFIGNAVKKGKLDDINIPENQKGKFLEYISNQNVEIKDGEVYLYRKVEPDTTNDILKMLYFDFRKGNLKDIAQNIAKQEKVIRLKSAPAPKGGTQAPLDGSKDKKPTNRPPFKEA